VSHILTLVGAFFQIKNHTGTSLAVKYYLVAYNALSAAGWAYVFALVLIHLSNLDGRSATFTSTGPSATSAFSRWFSSVSFFKSVPTWSTSSLEAKLPVFLQPILRRASTTFGRVGPTTAFVQTFAILEVVHVLLKWVRSPLATTIMQVSSRLFLVWAITEQFPAVSNLPHVLYVSSTRSLIRFVQIPSTLPWSLLGLPPRSFGTHSMHALNLAISHTCSSISDIRPSIYFIL
jgi:hypothetical protein